MVDNSIKGYEECQKIEYIRASAMLSDSSQALSERAQAIVKVKLSGVMMQFETFPGNIQAADQLLSEAVRAFAWALEEQND